VPIHYRGGGRRCRNLVSGRFKWMLIQGGGAIAQHVKAGKLVALAVSTAERSPTGPGWPAIAETNRLRIDLMDRRFAPAERPKPSSSACMPRSPVLASRPCREIAWRLRLVGAAHGRSASTLASAACRRSTIGLGRSAGAKTPVHEVDS